jgi:hypothetical protein
VIHRLEDHVARITTDHRREDAVDGLLYTAAPCDPPELGCTKPRYVFRVSSGRSGQIGDVRYFEGERGGLVLQTGSVSCLRVEGNRAAIGVEFAAGEQGTLAPRAAVIVVEDNGVVTADRFAVQNVPAGSAPSTCPSPAGLALGPAFGELARSTDPGVVVIDVTAGPPQPASKANCKHGGWNRFGFKNQGQCVAAVNHRTKPPPS